MGWIKLRHEVTTLPEIAEFVALLGVSKHEAIGVAVAWFLYADSHSVDGFVRASAGAIDFHTIPGFADALVTVGWLTPEDGGYRISNHERYMSESAKDRAEHQARAERGRVSKKKTKQEPDKDAAHHPVRTSAPPRAHLRTTPCANAHQTDRQTDKTDKTNQTAAAETRGREATPTGRPTAAAAAADDDFYSWLLGIGFTPEQAAETSEHENATPERVAWVRSEASARDNPGGFVRAAIRDGYAVPPSKRELRERKHAEKLAKLTGGDP